MKIVLRTAAVAAAAIAAALCLADGSAVSTQAETKLVTVSSRGSDVRDVLFDLFSQSGQSFILAPNVRFVLYLNLKDVDFDEALALILNTAGLKRERQNGITFISLNRDPKAKAPAPPAAQAKASTQASAMPEPRPMPAPQGGRLTQADLQKKLTTKLAVTDIRKVFEEISRQTGVKIEVSASVPAYRIDAFLNQTSLKYALDVITQAARLTYRLTDTRSIVIEKKG